MRVLTKGAKPTPWRVRRSRVHPRWRWVWDLDPIIYPLWEGAGVFRDVGRRGLESGALGSGWSWAHNAHGVVLRSTGSSTIALTGVEGIFSGPFSVVLVTDNGDFTTNNTSDYMETDTAFGWRLSGEKWDATGAVGATKINWVDLQTTFSSPEDRIAVIGMTVEPNDNMTIYVDGVGEDTSNTDSISGNNAVLGAAFQGFIGDYCAVYLFPNEELTAEQHRQIAADFYGLIREYRPIPVELDDPGPVTLAVAGALTLAGSLLNIPQLEQAGALTLAGATSNEPQLQHSGVLTTVGALTKRVDKVLAGALTTAGALVKQVNKVLAGTLTTAGALTNIKTALLTITGTLTTTGALVKTVLLTPSGSITPTGSNVKLVSKELAGTITPSGTVTKLISKILAGAVTLAGALANALIQVGGASERNTLGPDLNHNTLGPDEDDRTLGPDTNHRYFGPE